jgi:hypothetical protein
MTQKKHAAREALRAASDGLSDEIWEGQWDGIAGLKTHPIAQWLYSASEIIDELARRCPGHTRQEYQDALSRSMFTRR